MEAEAHRDGEIRALCTADGMGIRRRERAKRVSALVSLMSSSAPSLLVVAGPSGQMGAQVADGDRRRSAGGSVRGRLRDVGNNGLRPGAHMDAQSISPPGGRIVARYTYAPRASRRSRRQRAPGSTPRLACVLLFPMACSLASPSRSGGERVGGEDKLELMGM